MPANLKCLFALFLGLSLIAQADDFSPYRFALGEEVLSSTGVRARIVRPMISW